MRVNDLRQILPTGMFRRLHRRMVTWKNTLRKGLHYLGGGWSGSVQASTPEEILTHSRRTWPAGILSAFRVLMETIWAVKICGGNYCRVTCRKIHLLVAMQSAVLKGIGVGPQLRVVRLILDVILSMPKRNCQRTGDWIVRGLIVVLSYPVSRFSPAGPLICGQRHE
jgi:hypothetical protein